MMNMLVSVIIPSYKRSDTVTRAVNSVLNQSYKDFEVLVVDDNIPGDKYSVQLKKVIESINDKRVRLVTQSQHINGAKARNVGIENAKGEYVAFLDDDDEWFPRKLEKQIAFLKDNSNYKGCSVLYNEYKDDVLVHSCPPYTEVNLFQKIFRREVAVFTSTVLLNRECLIDSGMFDTNLKRHQDLQMLLRFTKKFKMGVLPEYLVKLHLDSFINRPNADAIVKVKENFFNSVSDLYKSCDRKERRLIWSAHCYEVMFAALKQRKLFMAILYFVKAGFTPMGFKLLKQRIADRKYVVS